jgi:ubiquinone/menaquinone biosynthesis C-methylase UbiE
MILSSLRKHNLFRKFYSSRLVKRWIQKKLQPVLPHLQHDDQVLDIGSGNGLICQHLQQLNYTCTALDLDNLSIVPDLHVTIYDGKCIPFENKSFDLALLLTVLHHSQNPRELLKESARVAQKIIIIEDIYSNKLQQYLTYAMDTLVNWGHSAMTYQNKSDKEWQALFRELGFELLSTSYRSIGFIFRQATYVVTVSE